MKPTKGAEQGRPEVNRPGAAARPWRRVLDWMAARAEEGFRHRVTPVGAMMMMLLLASGSLAFTTGQNVFFLLFSLLAAAILLSSFVNRLMLAGLRLELDLPAHVCAGQAVDLTLTLRNTKEWVTSFALEVKLEDGKRFPLPALAPLSAVGLRYGHRYERRGYPPPQVVELSTRFPFGFSVRRTKVQVLMAQPVYPAVAPQPGFADVLATIRQGQWGARARGSLEFSHLRDYQAGDSQKHVAWAASARRDGLLVKSFASEGEAEATLWFDRSSPDFERLVNLAAYLVWELQYQKDVFVFASDEGRWPVRDRMESYVVLRYLALVAAASGLPLPAASQDLLLSFRGLPAQRIVLPERSGPGEN